MGKDKLSDRTHWDDELYDKFVRLLMELSARKSDDLSAAVQVAKRVASHLEDIVGTAGDTRVRAAAVGGNIRAADGNSAAINGSGRLVDEDKKKDFAGKHLISRLRELVVLELLNQETRPVPLHEIQCVIAEHGFEDSRSAIISQLHRLHQNELIAKPGNMNGLYAITKIGRDHLDTLRSTHGGLLEDWLDGRLDGAGGGSAVKRREA